MLAPELQAAIDAAKASAPKLQVERPPTVKGRVLNIDGDYMAYYCSGNDETPPGSARGAALSRIERAMVVSGSEKTVVHLTKPGCHKAYRYMYAHRKPYQSQRAGQKHPVNWQFLRDFLSVQHPLFSTFTWRDREADDGIAFSCQRSIDAGREPAIMSRDKDFRMFPGKHVNWTIPEIVTDVPDGTFEIIGEDGLIYGHKWFWIQMLWGDAADFIPGLPKIRSHTGKLVQCGEARSLGALSDTSNDLEAAEVVITAYKDYFGDRWVLEFMEQAYLLWMRRTRTIDIRCMDFVHRLSLHKYEDELRHGAEPLWLSVEAKLAEVEALRSGVSKVEPTG